MGCEWLYSKVTSLYIYTWTVRMGGAGRSGAGLRMVSRVSVGGQRLDCVEFVYEIPYGG